MAQNEENKIEFQEAKANVKRGVKLTKVILVIFGFLVFSLRFLFQVPIPPIVPLILIFWFFLYLFYPYFLKKKKRSFDIYRLYFKYAVLDLFFLTTFIHYLGGAEWFGFIFYVPSLVLAKTVLPKKRGLFLSFITVLFYSSLVFLEYFQIIPHYPLFVLRPRIYRDWSFVFSQILVVISFLFFIDGTLSTFSERLRKKRSQLLKEREKTKRALEQAEEAKKVFEIRVRARTRELRELAERREEIIKERTKELQKELEELEKFRRLTVGREMKMVKLKKELKRSQEEIKELKKKPKTKSR